MAKESVTAEGTLAQPSDQGSDKAVSQAVSAQEYVTIDQFKAIEKSLEMLTRTMQSEKDRAVKRTNERIDSLEGNLKEVLQSAAKEGKTISDLLATVEQDEDRAFKDSVKLIAEQLKATGIGGKRVGNSQANGVDVSQVLKELELPTEDLRVKEFMTRTFTSKEDAVIQAAKLQKQILSSQPSDADLPSRTSDRVSLGSKQETLMAEYREGSKNLYGNDLIRFKSEMRKKGLDIS